MLHGVIMAGGSGTRFWPQSRRALPKQFLKIGTEQTLIQETASRCQPLIPLERLWVVTGSVHASETRNQLPHLPTSHLLVEPCARNTAPCIGLAAVCLLAEDPDATMLVMPADHVIQPPAAFQEAITRAAEHVESHPEALLLFGVTPNYPSTGFGYIQRGPAINPRGDIFSVAAFREKPDAATAASYVAAGNYAWNCGIFVWKAQAILAALAEYQPETYACLERLRPAVGTSDWNAALAREFPAMTSISIDYAVLERSPHACMMPAPFGWDDVGSWQALSRLIAPDDAGNTISGLHCGVATSNCIVRSTPEHLVATTGVQDLIIVHTPHSTLVASRNDEAAVKTLLGELERRGLSEYL